MKRSGYAGQHACAICHLALFVTTFFHVLITHSLHFVLHICRRKPAQFRTAGRTFQAHHWSAHFRKQDMNHVRLLIPRTRVSVALVFGTSFTAAWYYRPIADRSSNKDTTKSPIDENSKSDICDDHIVSGLDRSKEFFCSSKNPYIREHTPPLLEMARILSIGITTVAIRTFMNTYGSYDLQDDDHYQNFVKAVLGEGRTIGHTEGDSQSSGTAATSRGLVTVSNHRSLFDDPGIMSGILPWWMALQPKYNRWGICSQEYCFNDALPGIVKGYLGAGQVLPICRGGSINQKLLLDFARHLAAGEWVHVFPEGGVWQDWELGGRGRRFNTNEPGDATIKGKLKWGVGKLIAHAPVRPRVIPFAHAGMENLLPQDDNGKTSFKQNIWFGDPLQVAVKFGKEIYFDDIIDAHEKQHGRLWTYEATSSDEEESIKEDCDFHRKWDSSDVEKALYHKITKRIEMELEQLTRETVAEHKLKTQSSSL